MTGNFMNNTLESQITRLEARLRSAMLRSDVEELNALLAPELVFTNHLGHVMSKETDLSAHKSGMLKIEEITISEQHVMLLHEAAIVTVLAHIRGSFAGTISENDFRFTRVWTISSGGTWQVLAGHSSVVV